MDADNSDEQRRYRDFYRDLLTTVMIACAGADVEEAMDAISSAFEDLAPTLDCTQGPGELEARETEVVEKAINHIRDDRRRRPNPGEWLRKTASTLAGGHDLQPNLWENRQRVQQVLDSLTPKQAEATALIIDGFTPTEIAEMLGATYSAVIRRLRRAKKRLTQLIQQQGAGQQRQG